MWGAEGLGPEHPGPLWGTDGGQGRAQTPCTLAARACPPSPASVQGGFQVAEGTGGGRELLRGGPAPPPLPDVVFPMWFSCLPVCSFQFKCSECLDFSLVSSRRLGVQGRRGCVAWGGRGDLVRTVV